MLTVTDNAAAVIRDLTAAPQAPDGAGLRISTNEAESELTLSLTPEPLDGDEVVDADGALVFLDSQAAPLLSEMSLDAVVDEKGAVEFSLGEQLN